VEDLVRDEERRAKHRPPDGTLDPREAHEAPQGEQPLLHHEAGSTVTEPGIEGEDRGREQQKAVLRSNQVDQTAGEAGPEGPGRRAALMEPSRGDHHQHPGKELDGVSEARQHSHVEAQRRSEPQEQDGEQRSRRRPEITELTVEQEQARAAENDGNQAGGGDEGGFGSRHREAEQRPERGTAQIQRNEQESPDEGSADGQNVRLHFVAEKGVVVAQVEIEIGDERAREREVVHAIRVEGARVSQVEHGAQDEQGQKRPALAPRAQGAQDPAPYEGQSQSGQGDLKNRDPRGQGGPQEIGRHQSERQKGGTKAAIHGRFHYTFGDPYKS
jgi:hypothetical protein